MRERERARARERERARERVVNETLDFKIKETEMGARERAREKESSGQDFGSQDKGERPEASDRVRYMDMYVSMLYVGVGVGVWVYTVILLTKQALI